MADFEDARRLPDSTTLEVDICIVGGGVAGITLARAMAGRGRSILLLDAGGNKPGGPDQVGAAGEVVGLSYTRPDQTRAFGLGGTSAIWTGWCRPLDPLDFQPRPWVPDSGWPFGTDELEPFYRRAQAECEVGPLRYHAEDWAKPDRPRLPIDPQRIASPIYQFSPPTHWGRRYEASLRAAPDLRLLQHAHVTRLDLDDIGRRVGALHVTTLNRRSITVRAGRFVLAAGGIANPQLLLLSDHQQTHGLGNAHDLVGRYFADHPYFNASTLVLDNPDATSLSLYEGQPDPHPEAPDYHGKVLALLSMSEATQRRRQIVNAVFRFPEAFKTHRAFSSSAVWSLNQLRRHAQQGRLPHRWPAHVGALLRDPLAVAQVVVRKLTLPPHPIEKRRPMRVFLESAPCRDSRITLADRTDRLGRRVPRLDWQLHNLDLASLATAHDEFDAALRDANLGHLERHFDFDRAWRAHLQHGHHPLGTTRMHVDPAHGVVDAHGRVHGLTNLYVAGSSVFPTAGSANPTLTIVALTLRLAEHLNGPR
jgi:choline dehydrogenase-like flavoprotein